MRSNRRITVKNELIPIGLITLSLLALIAVGVYSLPTFLAKIRIFLGLLFVLFMPGFTLQAAIFPRTDDLDGPERLALSIGLSLSIIAPIALILDILPWGIDLWPMTVAYALLVANFLLMALLRRRQLPRGERFLLSADIDLDGWWTTQKLITRALYIILSLSLLIAAITALGALIIPKPGQFITEFYILGEEGLAESYPREAAPGEKLTVTMGINNKERREQTYRAEIWAVDPWTDNRDLVGAAGPFYLEQDQAIEEEVAWYMPWPGDDQVVDFYLYNLDSAEPGSPYRQLRLWLNVTE